MEYYCNLHKLRTQGLLIGSADLQTHLASHSLAAWVVIVAHSYAVEIEAEDLLYSGFGSR